MKNKFILSTIALIGLFPNIVKANTVYNDHTTMHYTKEEVLERYNASKPKYDYQTNGYYKLQPSYVAPFYEGELADGLKDDILTNLNYFRYLAGVKPVTVYTENMHRNQKAALTLFVNDELTHTPSQPAGMPDDFYQEAYKGAYVQCENGYCNSANASWNDSAKDLIKGYVDDSTNLQPNVGHRLSMIDPLSTKTSYGFIAATGGKGSYSTVSMYQPYSKPTYDDDFYPWPPAGYIPAESFPATTRTMWSMWLTRAIEKTDNTVITVEVNGKEFLIGNDDIYYDHEQGFSYNTIYYYVPTELNNEIRRTNSQYKTNIPINVKVKNLSRDSELVDIEYTTTFLQADPIPITSLELGIIVSQLGSSTTYMPVSSSFNMNKDEIKNFLVLVNPKDATIDKIELIPDDNSIVEIDNSTKTIKALKGGSTGITIKEILTGYTKRVTVNVTEEQTGIKLNKSKLTMAVGKTDTLTASIVPESASNPGTITWVSSNSNIVSVQNGTLTAHKEGTATITVKSKGFTATCVVTVKNVTPGDVDLDGELTLYDVLKALRIALQIPEELEKTTSANIEAGDFDENGSLDIGDVLYVLRAYLNQDQN